MRYPARAKPQHVTRLGLPMGMARLTNNRCSWNFITEHQHPKQCFSRTSHLVWSCRLHFTLIKGRCLQFPSFLQFPSPRTGDPGTGDSHMKQTGMLVVSLRDVNFGFWSRLGCSGQSANILSRQGLV